jgi:hypothetical protein
MAENTLAHDAGPWHDINVKRWPETKRAVHLYAQIMGKIRVALSPAQPNWMFTRLHLTPRGLTTGSIPCGNEALEVVLDVFKAKLVMSFSTGRSIEVALVPARTIAEIYSEVSHALGTLGVACFISTTPQEVADITPLHDDHRPPQYDRDAVIRWFETYTAIAGIFERWRSHFFGRSGVQVWWGAFDIALILFNGKHTEAPTDRGYLMKYDLDAELMNVGLYLGDENDAPFFYGYIYPQPAGAASRTLSNSEGAWSDRWHEWVLPYDAVRSAKEPEKLITDFIDAIYDVCFELAGWDREALSYEMPASHRRRVSPVR